MERNRKIVIIGTGGVAESIVASLKESGLSPYALMSPTVGHAERLAQLYAPETLVLHDYEAIPRDADVYLMAVSDRAIAEVVRFMPHTSGVWMHTAACIGLEVLQTVHPVSAVFYPLNTFTSGRPISLQHTPLLYETYSEKAREEVFWLADLWGMKRRETPLEQRKILHLSAVFACNFANHQWAIASQMLEQVDLAPELLHPLMEETLRKAMELGAVEGQTGPARRRDGITMEAHRTLLQSCSPLWLELYDLISHSIQTMQKS